MVCLDDKGDIVRPALLWNDLRSASQAQDLVEHLGGPQPCADLIGSVPTASFTVTKLAWLAAHEPANAARTKSVLLPHDWLTWKLAGSRPGQATTDHGDASGTGYYSPAERKWLPKLAEWALGHRPVLPRLAAPAEVVGHTSWGAALSAGTGDNMAAALGLGIEPGDIAISIGTSGAAFCLANQPTADPTGSVSGFASAIGSYLPLACTVNASRILSVTANLLGVDHDDFASVALSATPGAHGLTLLPYLDGERTPNRPDASGVLVGLTSGTTRQDFARAAVEALLCSLADAVDGLGTVGTRRVLLGGGARSRAVQHIAPAVFGTPIEVAEPAEYVALGAAKQAAWALLGTPTPPAWPKVSTVQFVAEPTPDVRTKYSILRDAQGAATSL